MLENKSDLKPVEINNDTLKAHAIEMYDELIKNGTIDSSTDKVPDYTDIELFKYDDELYAVFTRVPINEKPSFLSLKLKDTEK